MRPSRWVAATLATAFATTGCGGGLTVDPSNGSRVAAPTATRTGLSAVPDDQVYVARTSPTGLFSFSAPKDWTGMRDGTAVTFVKAPNSVHVVQYPAATAPTEASFRSGEQLALRVAIPGFRLRTVRTVTVPAGSAVRADYRAISGPDPATGATAEQDVQRYELWHRGQEVVLTLTGPAGVDNARSWGAVVNSVRWRR